MEPRPERTPQTAKKLNLFLAALGLVLLAAGLVVFALTGEKGYTVTTFSMGSYVQQTVYGKARETAAAQAASAVAQLEDKISWRVEGSDVFRLNEMAGKEFIEIDPVTRDILRESLEVCEKSGGAFDITIAPISRLWDFDENPHLPDPCLIEKFLPNVNYATLSIQEETAALRAHDTALDLGAVGKGAACDAAVRAYEEAGAEYAIVAVGGSVGVYGKKPLGKAWTIAVRDPAESGSLGTLSVYDGFLSTSGSYEKTFTENGVAYHHLLDAKTGYPAESGLLSVTVKSQTGVLSDALSTACFVLGLEDGLALAGGFGAEAVFITTENKIYVTKGLRNAFTLASDRYTLEELP